MRINIIHGIHTFDPVLDDLGNSKTIGFTTDAVIELVNNKVMNLKESESPYVEALYIYINHVVSHVHDDSGPVKCKKVNTGTHVQPDIPGPMLTCKVYYGKVTYFKANSVYDKPMSNGVKEFMNEFFKFIPAYSSLLCKHVDGKIFIYNLITSKSHYIDSWKLLKQCYQSYVMLNGQQEGIVILDLFRGQEADGFIVVC